MCFGGFLLLLSRQIVLYWHWWNELIQYVWIIIFCKTNYTGINGYPTWSLKQKFDYFKTNFNNHHINNSNNNCNNKDAENLADKAIHALKLLY